MRWLANLRSACLPFVTRSAGGPRSRMLVALSSALAVLTVVFGVWTALGAGEFEREVRRGLDLEPDRWTLMDRTFKVVAEEDYDYEQLLAERRSLLQGTVVEGGWGVLAAMRGEAAHMMIAATTTPAPPELQPLKAELAELLARTNAGALWEQGRMRSFSWHDPQDVAYLRAVIEADFVPTVERYTSPFDGEDAVRMVGGLAGLAALALLLVIGPTLAGIQLAQEAHENTLQPLTGTSLNTRELVVGLTSGPLTVAAILAVPQLGLFVITAIVAGYALPALAMVLLLLATAIFCTMLAQLVGLALGKQRPTGVIALMLLAGFGILALFGLGFGLHLDDGSYSLVSVLPHTGVAHLLREALAPAGKLSAMRALGVDVRMAFGGLVVLALTALTALALERRIVGRVAPSLGRVEALLGVMLVTICAYAAVPGRTYTIDPQDVWIGTLALVLLPNMCFLMSRVPTGDVPAKLRKVPLIALLGEFGGYFALHLGLAFALIAPSELVPHTLGGPLNVLWALVVAGLLAVRAMATPIRLLSALWLGFGAAAVVFRLTVGLIGTAESGGPGLLPLWDVSAMLGVIEVALLVWIPWSHVRALRKHTGGPR